MILWQTNPKNFKEWKQNFGTEFVIKLKNYLLKTNQFSAENFKNFYQILFYYSFINFKKEQELKRILEAKGFKIDVSNVLFDSVFLVDLIGNFQDKKYYFQVKQNIKSFNTNDQNKFKNLSINHQCIPVLAVKKQRFWHLINLLNMKEIVAK